MIVFYKNTELLTPVEQHLLNLIGPEPTNAHMDVTVNYYEDIKTYETVYFLNDAPVGVWVYDVVKAERKYLSDVKEDSDEDLVLDVLIDVLLDEQRPSFEETQGQIIKRLRQAYQQLDVIRYDLEVWNDAIDELLPKGIEKLAFEVENIVDKIEDVINKVKEL